MSKSLHCFWLDLLEPLLFRYSYLHYVPLFVVFPRLLPQLAAAFCRLLLLWYKFLGRPVNKVRFFRNFKLFEVFVLAVEKGADEVSGVLEGL